jgi:hypothetical protein
LPGLIRVSVFCGGIAEWVRWKIGEPARVSSVCGHASHSGHAKRSEHGDLGGQIYVEIYNKYSSLCLPWPAYHV